ncbi:MAG: segregation/condensation protein A [Gammaproteobacteria bacterium]|nr:segregation/condensation protein A [Gammaproteobacteria bacterium]
MREARLWAAPHSGGLHPVGSHAAAAQSEFPFAIVEGRTVTELPKDLYIPPDALEVFLEAFEGPLDLLLYLIRRQNLDILDIRVADITRQYMQYVELMKALHFELAAEYLVMAAMLAEIKSRMLLPRPASEDEESEDPRAELIRRLQEYERFRQAAEDIDALPRTDREIFPASAVAPPMDRQQPLPELELKELLLALSEVMQRAAMYRHHNIKFDTLSTRERMGDVLRRVSETGDFVPFVSLFRVEEGRLGVVVTFLAIMELVKESLIELVQNEPLAPIHVRARVHAV